MIHDDDVMSGWCELYSLEEDDHGFAIVPFDRFGRAIRRHPLTARSFASPSEAFDAIKAYESSGRLAKTRPLPPDDELATGT